MAIQRILFCIVLIYISIHADAATNYWTSDNRVIPAGYGGGGKFYAVEHVYEPEYYYPDEEYSNHIGRHPVHGSPAYPVTSRHRSPYSHETTHWRHRLVPQPGSVMVPQRKHNHIHEGRNAIKTNKLPTRKTSGIYRTRQKGTVTIPHIGAKVKVPATSGNNKVYRGTITTTVLNPQQSASWATDHNILTNSASSRFDPGLKAVQDQPDTSSFERMCVRCPDDRLVIANKETTYVRVESPAVKPCQNTAAARSRLAELRVEPLFGPRPGTKVGEGIYNIGIRIIHNREEVTMCKYRYHVSVRKCPPLHLPEHVHVRCSLNNFWGSRCHVTCSQGYQLVGSNVTECGDKVRWSNPLPHCIAMKGCPLPMSPENGRLSCETPGSGEGTDISSQSGDLLEEGSICRYDCDPGYSVPQSQMHLSVIRCRSHSWNSTADPSCEAENSSIQQLVFSDSEFHHPLRHHRKRAPCWANPCQGGGTCFNGPHPSKPMICICPPDREGEYCERVTCKNEACQNGGHCMVLGDRAICYCPPGFTGEKCEQLQDMS